jgi:hypothetical protein
VKRACSFRELRSRRARMTSRRERHSTLGSCQWKAPPASSKASAVRAAGLRRGLGRLFLRGGSSSRGRRLDDKGVLGEARVGLCCRRAHADSDDFGRWGRRFRVLDSTPPLVKTRGPSGHRARKSQKWRFRRGSDVRSVCPVFRVVAEVRKRRQVQASSAGCGWWSPRGPSPEH